MISKIGQYLVKLRGTKIVLNFWATVYKVVVAAFSCVRGTGPAYFRQVCLPVTDITGLSHLHSAERHDMLVPRTRTQFD